MDSTKPSIFISYTQDEAPLAIQIKGWIDQHFGDHCTSFVSQVNIELGEQWLESLGKALQKAELIIVLCSPSSVRKPWVLFESGGAWGRNIPLLPICHSGLTVSALPSPLSAFQGLDVEGSEFPIKFMMELAGRLKMPITQRMDANAARMQLEGALRAAMKSNDRYSLFVSVPMSSWTLPWAYQTFVEQLQPVFEAISSQPALATYYFSGKEFRTPRDFDPDAIGVDKDLAALDRSDRFLLIMPKKLPTSCLAEAGYALAKGIPALYFARERVFLPYMLREISQVSRSVRTAEYQSLAEVARTIKERGIAAFPKGEVK